MYNWEDNTVFKLLFKLFSQKGIIKVGVEILVLLVIFYILMIYAILYIRLYIIYVLWSKSYLLLYFLNYFYFCIMWDLAQKAKLLGTPPVSKVKI